MILVDLNVLIYAYHEALPFHRKAKLWLERTVDSGETIGLPWQVVLGFLRIMTKRGISECPLTVEEAFQLLEQLIELPQTVLVEPGPRHFQLVRSLLREAGVGGDLVADAHLAAMAIENGSRLCSVDRDMGRFTGVKWVDPLRGE